MNILRGYDFEKPCNNNQYVGKSVNKQTRSGLGELHIIHRSNLDNAAPIFAVFPGCGERAAAGRCEPLRARCGAARRGVPGAARGSTKIQFLLDDVTTINENKNRG